VPTALRVILRMSKKLILKEIPAFCNEGAKKSLENMLILQNKTEAKTSHSPSEQQQ